MSVFLATIVQNPPHKNNNVEELIQIFESLPEISDTFAYLPSLFE